MQNYSVGRIKFVICFVFIFVVSLAEVLRMPSFVYSCEKCSSELRFMVSRALEENITVHCPQCNDIGKFVLEREGNVGKDWCRKVTIKNKRRRDDDGLYNSPVREQVLAS